jgi:predicted kinase
MPAVLILTGTCGSGKSTLSQALATHLGWTHLSEDAVWTALFGLDRGAFGTEEHRAKRASVHRVIFSGTVEAVGGGGHVVIDATVHEAPPESYHEYLAFFAQEKISWAVRVLHPRLEIAVDRAQHRAGWRPEADRVSSLYAKFTKLVFPAEWFLDTSEETVQESVEHIQRSVLASNR